MTDLADHETTAPPQPQRGATLGWWLAGLAAVGGAMALWIAFADAVFVSRVLAALANCF